MHLVGSEQETGSQERLIEELEDLLNRAKSGDVNGVIYGAQTSRGSVLFGDFGEFGLETQSFMLSCMQADFFRALELSRIDRS